MATPTLSVPLGQWAAAQTVLESPISPANPTHGPASLPVPNPTKSFWIDTPGANPLAGEGSTGELTKDADVCIIGSGITGVSAAYHLFQALKDTEGRSGDGQKLKVVILEARDFCSGATGRNGGHLTPNPFVSFLALRALYGTDEAIKSFALENYTASSLAALLQQHQLGDSVDLVKGGHTTVFLTQEEEKAVRADYEVAKEAGVDLTGVKWLSKEEMQETYGTPYPGVQGPGHNLWPLKLVTQLYNLAKSATPNLDLALHTRTPVTSISPISSSEKITTSTTSPPRHALHTPRGPITCSYVVHATNAYASHLLPHLAGPDGIVPTRGQIIALRANTTLPKGSWDGNDGFEYWFPRPQRKGSSSGKEEEESLSKESLSKESSSKEEEEEDEEENSLVILGGARESTAPHFELYQTDDSSLHPKTSKALKGFLPGLFSGKYEEGREPEMEWTGIMGYTKLREPFVGPVIASGEGKANEEERYAGQYIAAGYTGHGMPRAFACAEVVAGMIAADVQGETWARPEWLPERYLTWARP